MDINLLLRDAGLSQAPGRLLPNDRLVRELLSGLRPGQSLQAQVLAAPRADLARLLVDGLAITARTGRPLQPGQTLLLTVLTRGAVPELRVELPPQPPGSQQVLRLALPRQLPLHDTLSGLARVANQAMPLLGQPAREALRGLLDRSVPVQQMSSQRVREAVRDSGIFSEARMARGETPAPTDRKALLMQLANTLPPKSSAPLPTERPLPHALTRANLASAGAPPAPLTRAALLAGAGTTLLGGSATSLLEAGAPRPVPTAPQTPEQALIDRLWRLVEASLARIQTHQAASLPADDNAAPVWQLDIPLALPGGPTQAVELRIRRDAEGADPQTGDGGWLVTIGFLFPVLGPVKAGVRLTGGRISSTFWCEQPAAALLFERYLPRLRESLQAAGLDVAHLAACQGKPPPEDDGRVEERLLDERV